jgi:hypothetical protein
MILVSPLFGAAPQKERATQTAENTDTRWLCGQ